MAVQPGLCGTWSETPKTGFLRTRLIFDCQCHTEVFITIYEPFKSIKTSLNAHVRAKMHIQVVQYLARKNILRTSRAITINSEIYSMSPKETKVDIEYTYNIKSINIYMNIM